MAACASAWRHVNSQSTAARRRALLQSGHGATSTAMAQLAFGERQQRQRQMAFGLPNFLSWILQIKAQQC
jgi:hypothetical protein